LLIWGRPVTDAAVLTEILERWHPAKLKISKPKWQETLDWMREYAFVPAGFGRATATAPQDELF
jgi:type I restriction enzyme S subunit